MRRLEEAVIATLDEFGIAGEKDPAAIGVWVNHGNELRKICALGVRIRRGVAMHGLALNVTTDLRYFDLIVPCGLRARGVTSMRQAMGAATPGMDRVKETLARQMVRAFAVE
jgi:lipoyl(octanoyl) transferase